MFFNLIEKGNTVNINPMGDLVDVYQSEVVLITDKDELKLAISLPESSSKLLKLSDNTRYQLLIQVTNSGCQFTAEFIRYVRHNEEVLAEFRMLDTGRFVQKRGFFRFTCLIDMEFLSLDFLGDPVTMRLYEAGYMPTMGGIIRDIGGGGIRFISNADLDLQFQIEFYIPLAQESLKIKGAVMNKQNMENSEFKYQYRASFADISDTDKEKIIQFIFKEQRKQRKIAGAKV